MKIGDKVIDDYLGDGEIVNDLTHIIKGAFMVKFDKTPPIRYNMGQNPTMVFNNSLKLQDQIT